MSGHFLVVTARGLIVLGGPLGDPAHGEHVGLLCRAASEREIRAELAEDPWSGHLLLVDDVQPWTLWLP